MGTKYQIGEFSQMAQISVKQLKYYEQCGLIIPAHVDSSTGYRYYEVCQLRDVAYVRAFINMGFKTSEITELLNTHNFDQIFAYKEKQLLCELEMCERKLQLLRFYSQNIDKNESRQQYCPMIKKTPEGPAAIKHVVCTDARQVIRKWAELLRATEEAGAVRLPAIKSMTRFVCDKYQFDQFEVELLLFLRKFGEKSDQFEYVNLPETLALSVIHHGAYNKMNEVYAFAYTWIEENGYEPNGKPMESYYVGPYSGVPEEDYVTELWIPIQKIT